MVKPDRPGASTTIRCAIYTRKSSDEGLEQEFNSLDAQREACEAYIVSQRHAGWVALPEMYDDGGLSGGTMERPALQQLLTDIKASKIQIVVVYKVDRLTRSLADFAKIVDVLDAHGASFVSVTQQFNTTTSMGRLTLNMLLSFAQFEREIAGERIRDKIAASKAKGMWMGGNVPLGYDVRDRKLVINAIEADTVRLIFRRYAQLGSVTLLRSELDRQGVVSKRREGATGRLAGGQRFSRGALYLMLQNRIYRSEIIHKGSVYPGQHEAIIVPELWQIVQDKLAGNRHARTLAVGAEAPSLLAGLMVDADGSRMTPTHAGKRGKRYRYYVSAPLIGGDHTMAPRGLRSPAGEIEGLVLDRLRALLASGADLIHAIAPLDLDARTLELALGRAANMAARWLALAPVEVSRLVRHVVERVAVAMDRIDVRINRGRLAEVLGASQSSEWANAPPITLSIEAWEWRRLHRMPPPMRLSRDLLIRGITYKHQERALGGLSKSALRKLEPRDELATRSAKAAMPIAMKPGTRLVREWHGVTHTVSVHADGFEWRGKRYRSLSIIAKAITGAHWSGPRFFGLRRRAAGGEPAHGA